MGDSAHRIDRGDRIVHIDDGWTAFAHANGAAALVSAVLGRLLWDYICDPTTAWIYREIVRRMRGRPSHRLELDFRCDAPETRRFMRMVVSADDAGEVTFISRLLREERRPRIPLQSVAAADQGRVLLMCSWCKRVHGGRGWRELETAIQEDQFFAHAALPLLSHGICPECQERVMKTLES